MLKGKGVDVDPKGVLSINPTTGVIKVHRKVDFEEYKVLMVRDKHLFYCEGNMRGIGLKLNSSSLKANLSSKK